MKTNVSITYLCLVFFIIAIGFVNGFMTSERLDLLRRQGRRYQQNVFFTTSTANHPTTTLTSTMNSYISAFTSVGAVSCDRDNRKISRTTYVSTSIVAPLAAVRIDADSSLDDSSTTSPSRNNGSNEIDIDNDNGKQQDNQNDKRTDLLSYLGTQEVIDRIPPQTRDLLRRITYNYIFGTQSITPTTRTSVQEMVSVIESEHRSRDVPVQITDTLNDSNAVLFIADVTKSGEAFDELCAEVLSIGALYRLPKEIVLELLASIRTTGNSVDSNTATLEYSPNTQLASSISKCRTAFATTGWDGVDFPMGLAIRPKTKFRSIWSLPILRKAARNSERKDMDQSSSADNEMKNLPLSWFHRNKTLRGIAISAVQNAAKANPPPRQIVDRRLYLSTLDQQIRQITSASKGTSTSDNVPVPALSESTVPITSDVVTSLLPPVIGTREVGFATGQLFFPNADPRWWQKLLSLSSKRLSSIGNVIRTVRRTLAQQYNALKRQGRAGLISYCLFNFLYYTIGMIWQWPRMSILPTSTTGNDVISNLLTSSSTIISSSFLQNPQLSIPALLLRKFGKIFACLYAFSQLLKIPKLCTAVGLAPLSSKVLDFIQVRCNVKETSATVIMIASMILLWSVIIAFPILSEYASLKHVLYLEEQILQVYGIQPA